MSNLHPACQIRKLSSDAVHLMVNLKHEKVNSGAFLKSVQLWVGICELYVAEFNDFFQPPNPGVENMISMECLFLKIYLKGPFLQFSRK